MVQPFLLDPLLELLDLALVEQQPARARRLVVGVAAVLVRRDVAAHEPQPVAVDGAERLLQVDLPCPQRLHLGPLQFDPGLDAVEQLVLVPRAAIRDDDLDVLSHGDGVQREES